MICKCGSKFFLVERTDHDEDNWAIRIRRCRNCGEKMATEERKIPLEAFFSRAVFHDTYRIEAEKRTTRTCRFCGNPYRGQSFSRHCRTPKHNAALKHDRTPAIRERERRARQKAYWKRRGIDLDVADEYRRNPAEVAA